MSQVDTDHDPIEFEEHRISFKMFKFVLFLTKNGLNIRI